MCSLGPSEGHLHKTDSLNFHSGLFTVWSTNGEETACLPPVVSAPSRSPGLFTLLCAHRVFFNYMEWNFCSISQLRKHAAITPPISDNDSLNFQRACFFCVCGQRCVCVYVCVQPELQPGVAFTDSHLRF